MPADSASYYPSLPLGFGHTTDAQTEYREQVPILFPVHYELSTNEILFGEVEACP